MRLGSRLIAAALILPAAAGVSPARAQRGGATLAGGVSRYSLQGATGYGLVGAFRFEVPVRLYMIVEPSVSFLRWQPLVGAKSTHLMPELGLQVQGYMGRLRPYVGGGLGYSTPTRRAPGLSQDFFTLHAAAGVRLYLSRRLGLRAELRARSVDPWQGMTYDMTLGIIQVPLGR